MKRNEHRRGWGGQPAKVCSGCNKLRLLKFYHANAARWDGKSHRCILCERLRNKAINLSQPERARGYSRMWRAGNPHKRLEYELRTVYGITVDQYENMRKVQENLCAICGQSETKKLRGKVVRLAIDHCHTTNKVRGLLCQNCNHGIGMLKDNVSVMRRAIHYLEASLAS